MVLQAWSTSLATRLWAFAPGVVVVGLIGSFGMQDWPARVGLAGMYAAACCFAWWVCFRGQVVLAGVSGIARS